MGPLAGGQVRTIFFVWLGWALLLVGFQGFVQDRFQLVRPDRTLDWTATWTNGDAASRHPYLQTPILGGHAAWDSEFYISIALHGYEDPAMKAAAPTSTPDAEIAGFKKDHPKWVSLNHAFFPGYPLAMGVIARPLAATGMNPIGAATVAGVIVSLVSALAAMLAIADLAFTQSDADEGDPLRAAVYLALWPAAMFMAQVYSEALFVALSFGALACLKRGAWTWAAALAVAAVFTRATGVLLVAPFGLTWLGGGKGRTTVGALLALSPALAYVAWRVVFGADFDFVETKYFGRHAFDLGASWNAWADVFDTLSSGTPLSRSYWWIEIFGAVAGLATTVLMLRRDPPLAFYGLAIFAVVLTSGAALGMHRYVLSVPSLFLVPAAIGRSAAFDRVWSLACSLGLAVLAISFSFGFWAG